MVFVRKEEEFAGPILVEAAGRLPGKIGERLSRLVEVKLELDCRHALGEACVRHTSIPNCPPFPPRCQVPYAFITPPFRLDKSAAFSRSAISRGFLTIPAFMAAAERSPGRCVLHVCGGPASFRYVVCQPPSLWSSI